MRLSPFVNVQMKRPEPIRLEVTFLLKTRVVITSLSPGLSPCRPMSTRV